MNEQIHPPSLEIKTRSLSHILQISRLCCNNMYHASVLGLCCIAVAVVVMSVRVIMPMIVIVIVMSMTSRRLVFHPHSDARITYHAS